METTEISGFAMTEAAFIRAALDDTEWEDLLKYRPSLDASLEAYRRATPSD
ncbi:hypothetical protein [Streptomyces zaomyceticus]|uniref:hypothetical protein n=1 Tax=Streptomyces zaomyceticus TaxID=68286 RepID=UPI002E155B81|nr:hypothetical protein OG237_44125 [Streptomyces zaomyceticus]